MNKEKYFLEKYLKIDWQSENKAKAKMTEDQYKKAIDFVKGGGAISAIQSKYNVSGVQMQELCAAQKAK